MRKLLLISIVLVLTAGTFSGLYAQGPVSLEVQINKALLGLPYYQVFDRIEFQVEEGIVTLSGETTGYVLKSTVEKALSKLTGVREVKNEIEVLPYSPYDDRLRVSVFRAIYFHPLFNYYSTRNRGSIHIIVNNGDVRLAGAVRTESDKTTAGILARGVSGVFTVTNDLEVEA